MNMKVMMIHSAAGFWYPASESGCGENPPAASVAIEWQIASNHDKPARRSATTWISVSAAYRRHSSTAVRRICGLTLSSLGPGDSAKNSSRPPIESRGRMATNSAITPIPPSQWVRPRHRNTACP